MEFTAIGKITALLPARTGVSQNNKSWISQDFVMETSDGQKLCFNVFGEKAIQNSGLKLNANVAAVLDIVSRPSRDGDKYFTIINLKQAYVMPFAPKADPQRTASAGNVTSANSDNIPTPITVKIMENQMTQAAHKQMVADSDLPF